MPTEQARELGIRPGRRGRWGPSSGGERGAFPNSELAPAFQRRVHLEAELDAKDAALEREGQIVAAGKETVLQATLEQLKGSQETLATIIVSRGLIGPTV